MASKEQLKAVASHCSQYRNASEGTFTSSIGQSCSCENCEHFTKAHKCNINLVDEILTKITNEG